MTFLQPWLLWGLPLAALPIVVHLLNLRRHRQVEWGAMMFLLQATRQRRGHTRLRHLLILLARTLAVAGLILVISRPMAGRWFGLLGGRPETVIVVLDRSASMAQQDLQSGQSKRALAVQQIASAVERAGSPRDLVLVESTGRPPQRLASPAALREIPETGATDSAANVPAMLQSALDYIVANRSGRTDIWICSDLQATDWMADAGQWPAIRSGFTELKQPIRFHLLTYPQRPTDNLTVRMLDLQRQPAGDSDQLLMDIELGREGAPSKTLIPLGIVVDGARSVVDVELASNTLRLNDHIVPIDRQRRSGWGRLELPNDDNPRDNVYFFTYGNSSQRRSAIVSDEPGTAWPLRLAAAPSQQTENPETVVLARDQLSSLRWDEISLLLWQVPLPNGEVQQRLEDFIRSGGSVLFFPPLEDDDREFLGYSWGPWQKLASDDAQAIEQWRDDSGLLAHADSGDPLPVNRIEIQDYRKLQGNGQVLAKLRGSDPLVVRVPTDEGGVFFCATLPQEPYSNLAREGIVFFVMVQRAMQQGAQRLLAAQFGEIQGRSARDEQTAWQRVEGWQEGSLSTEQPWVAGIYQSEDRLLARNRPSGEDTSGTVGTEQLDRLLAGLNYRVVEDNLQTRRSLVAEIWRVFVGLLLAALVAEALLCLPDVRPKKLVTA